VTGVIHVVTALERGGAQRVVLETAARLHDPGRPQLVVTGGPAALDGEAEERLGRRLLRLPRLKNPIEPLNDAAALIALADTIDHTVSLLGSPVVVHSHSSKAGVLARLAARSVRGVVVVHTVHGWGTAALGPRHAWLLEAAERVAAEATDVLIFVSEADRARAASAGLLRRARAETIRAGIDGERFYPLREPAARRAARRGLGVSDETLLVVTVGNLKAQKDPLHHVEILARARQREPRLRLALLGDGPLRPAVVARARALGVEDALDLPGFVEDPAPYLAAADAFLLASAWEGLPCAVLEATAAGLSCVVKDTGWATDLSWARGLRALPATATADDFARALVDAVQRRARGRLPRAFTLAGMLGDLGRLYDELIGPPRDLRPRRRGRPRRR
jgi:glycosyltransferase involved in cell wall biosynthesis